MEPSSRDLHPRTGARFVFDRQLDSDPPRYDLNIYFPGALQWSGQLSWTQGQAQLEASARETAPDERPPDEALSWARAEAIKLARVLHRSPKAHMVRWRGDARP